MVFRKGARCKGGTRVNCPELSSQSPVRTAESRSCKESPPLIPWNVPPEVLSNDTLTFTNCRICSSMVSKACSHLSCEVARSQVARLSKTRVGIDIAYSMNRANLLPQDEKKYTHGHPYISSPSSSCPLFAHIRDGLEVFFEGPRGDHHHHPQLRTRQLPHTMPIRYSRQRRH